jgi:ATP-dependent protease Clp ATPase subunit
MSQSKKLFKVLDEYIYFDTAQESQEYAKNNPGKVIIRNTEVVDKEVQKPNYKQEPMMEKTPRMILDYLNQHIISQDEAKKEIALAIYYHSLKLEHPLNDDMLTNAPIMFAMEDSNYQVSTNFSTKYVQFILGGAFQPILDKKQEKKSVMGFATKPTKRYKQKITLQDLYSTNVPKELLGRMGTVVNLYPLNKEDYYKILTQSESSPLKEFINRVEFHGGTVDIDEHTLYEVAQYASRSKLGVRAIKQALKSMFSDALFYAADGEHKTHKITFKEDIL